MQMRSEDDFADLSVRLPCCCGESSLDLLQYDWPCGFARFQIAVLNPHHAWFDQAQLISLETALGHSVRQIRAHI